MIIEIKNLKKSFKDIKAVDGISFKVKEGELFAFLGVNGAGKSTTINVICGILPMDEGEVSVCGCNAYENSEKVKEKIGIVFQNSVLDKRLTVAENLKMRAALYGITGKKFAERLDELKSLLDFGDIIKRPVCKLSGGQRRKIDVARALLHKPEILILDEPTTGLDPKTRATLWSVIGELRRSTGLTVFLTTHYMEEAADADYVVIIDGGKIVAEGTPHELKNRFAGDFIRFYDNIEEAEKYFQSLGFATKRERDFLQVEIKGTDEIARIMRENPRIFNDFEVLKGNMDDVFIKITGKNLKEV